MERFNSTLIDSLRTYSLSAGSLWDEVLNAVLFAYRTSFHGGINISPDVLIFGQSLHVPLDVELQQVLHTSSLSPSDPAFIFAHAAALARAREQARDYMDKYKITYEARYNQSHRRLSFNLDDLVWLQVPSPSNKFAPRWKGPYRVYGKPSETTYLIHDALGNVRPSPVSVQNLKPVRFDTSSIDGFPLSNSSVSLSSSSSSTTSRLGSQPLPRSASLPPSTSVRPFHFPSRDDYVPFSPNHAYDVERILQKRMRYRKTQYLVKWTGYDSPTWEPVELLDNCKEAIQEFEDSRMKPSTEAKQHQRLHAPFARALPAPTPVHQVSSTSSSSTLTTPHFIPSFSPITPFFWPTSTPISSTSSSSSSPSSSPATTSSSASSSASSSSSSSVSTAVPSSAFSSSFSSASTLSASFPAFPQESPEPSSHPSTSDEFRVPATDSSSDLSAASTSAATSTRLTRSSGRVDPTTLLIPPHLSRELDALNALPRADQARSRSISTASS